MAELDIHFSVPLCPIHQWFLDPLEGLERKDLEKCIEPFFLVITISFKTN